MTEYASVYNVLNTSGEMEVARKRLTKKLRGFKSLQRGWSHGEGIPIATLSIREAEFIVYVACDLGFEADVFPNLDGGCAVAVYEEDECLEVSIGPNCRYDLRIEKGIGTRFEVLSVNPEVDLVGAITALIRFRRPTWSLGSWIYDSTTVTVGDLETPHIETQGNLLMSGRQTTEVDFQSSR